MPAAYLTLQEAVAVCAELAPGAGITVKTLRRNHLTGTLRLCRPGRAMLTTRADLIAMIEATQCHVQPKGRVSGSGQPAPPASAGQGATPPTSSATAHAKSAQAAAQRAIEKLKKPLPAI